MMNLIRKICLCFSISFALVLNFTQAATPTFKKVMIIMLENENGEKVLKQPTFNKLARSGGYLTNLTAEVHPSQANYIALISGDLHGVRGDRPTDIDGYHIGDLIENAGLTWKTYLEGYPGGCFTGSRNGDYVRKHNPFISFRNIQSNQARCASHLVNATELASDIARESLPSFSLYIPDLKNDGHDTGVAYSDRWFAQTFGPLLSDPRFMRDMLLIVTFDESELLGGNRIYGALYGESVQPGSTSGVPYNHYSILRTIEDALHLGSLGLGDRTANPIVGIWR